MRRKLAAGNWKMNGTSAALSELEALARNFPSSDIDILICPPATLLHRAAGIVRETSVSVGGQDCQAAVSGAHTGDISADMLVDAGASAVIVGHSERREDHGEQNETVRAKASAAMGAGIKAIVCVGESLEQRETSKTLDVIADQIAGSVPDQSTGDNLVVAYEPIWAIGTGKVPSLSDIQEVHDFIRTLLDQRFGKETAQSVPLLYGGSVKPDNASDIFGVPNVDGALVGGASLKASDFSVIVKALEVA
ncbi:triose-phosphate isomerase [Ruegeria profundi]|uniref:Triosephosphate isomerase n=1 Tax=Ruegeria profundi TaxID=1685378 RepID=A0A0X3TWU9_9RHOB|nr:triose-phosphate isomerase [Ruegeria profundi]KUJ80149.1 triose-phosphate isomerase [Ruegeria profundi]